MIYILLTSKHNIGDLMTAEKHYDVIIIGSGPAGYTSAIYTSRANLKVLVLEGLMSGGQLMITTEVENFPGFPEGVTGPDMMELFRKQAEKFGAELISENVTKIDLQNGSPFKVWTEEEAFTGDSVIVATGATARYLGLESEHNLKNFGVSACATCDGFLFANKEVAVIGGGDTAMEEASYLTRMCSKVHVIHRREELRATKIMQKRILENDKAKVHWNKVVLDVLGSQDTGVTGIKLKDTVTGEVSELPVSAMFVGIGHVPNTAFIEGQLKTDEAGYLIAEQGSSKTDIEGVFAAGDVRDQIYRQAITAAASGCMAAIDAERWLEEKKQ